ncbi:hypothetical protein FACS1894193_02320 [Bacilli bacterium]|nr:hypothetical protein FACS1894193_02320 [Bacilli bacterium]
MDNLLRSTTMIFEQQLKPDYWKWSDDKKALFENWQANKAEIFKEIYTRIKNEISTFSAIALIIHDKDKNNLGELVEPHIHCYVEFEKRLQLSRLADTVGIAFNYIEPTKKGRYGRINSKAYLIHAKQPDKFQYSPENVETFETIDYFQFIKENATDFQKQTATVKRKDLDLSFDLIRQALLTGNMKRDDLMNNDDLKLLYGMNQTAFNESMDFYGFCLGHDRLKKLKNQDYKLTVLYIQGTPGIGKTFLANEIAEKIEKYGIANGFESKIYNAASSNPFDEYVGEDILILDDLRVKSLSVSDWLKIFDPLNSARMSARYRNKMVVPRVIIVANYQSPVNFFKELKGEDIDQFVRRVGSYIQIQSKQFPEKDFDNIYNLSEVIRLDRPRNIQISKDEFITLNFDFKAIKKSDDKEKFIKQALDEFILPRSFPKDKN